MPILLSHNSSLERLRSVPPQVDKATIMKEPLPLPQFAHVGSSPTELDLRSLGLLQRPVHLLVPPTRHGHFHASLRTHCCSLGALGPYLTKQIREDVYCCGPELAFIQMAGETSLIGAVVLGHELCGTYSPFAQMISGFYERPALTSVDKLRAATDAVSGMRGVKAARKALRWIRDGSASPMETVVSCMLSLPTAMGGYGMVLPKLNHEVTLDANEARIAGTSKPRIDTAYTEVLVGVEFDGKDYHRDAEADRKRREALAHKGWTIYALNVDELTTFSRLKEKVALLDTVPRQPGETMPGDEDAKSLLKRLLAATRCGVGTNAALFGTNVPLNLVKVHL